MRKFFSRLIRKIPPFKKMYARLDKLQQENKTLRKRSRKQQDELQRHKQKIAALKAENKQTRRELKQLKRTQDQQLRSLERKLDKDIEYAYFRSLTQDQYEDNLKEWYFRRTGQSLHLADPQTYNEKIQWLKLYDSTPLKTQLADKYRVRDWVREKIGEEYLIPLLGVYDRFDDIDFDKLPDQFVIKTNHACKSNRIVTDKAQFDRNAAKRFFDQWMRKNYAYCVGLELQYKDIEPKILIETYLENHGHQPSDYKVLCFDGKPQFIEYITERELGEKKAIFDTDWNRLPVAHTLPAYTQEVKKPENLEQMLRLAEILSAGFAHVRVDFYCLDDGSLKFGEMTFTPASGIGRWTPEDYNRIMGTYLKLPERADV